MPPEDDTNDEIDHAFEWNTKSDNNINIMDDVYYYQHDLTNIVIEEIQEGETVYVDDDIWNDNYMEDEIIAHYEEESEEWEEDEE